MGEKEKEKGEEGKEEKRRERPGKGIRGRETGAAAVPA